MSIISNIVGNLNVGAPNGEVLRRVRGAMKKKTRRDPSMRSWRKSVYLEALREHESNRVEYVSVMGRPADHANTEQVIARHLEGRCLSNCICKE